MPPSDDIAWRKENRLAPTGPPKCVSSFYSTALSEFSINGSMIYFSLKALLFVIYGLKKGFLNVVSAR